MENTIQKTVHVLSQLTPSGQGPSKSFQVLVRSIGEAKTKHEEDRIIRREALTLKDRMASRDNNPVCVCVCACVVLANWAISFEYFHVQYSSFTEMFLFVSFHDSDFSVKTTHLYFSMWQCDVWWWCSIVHYCIVAYSQWSLHLFRLIVWYKGCVMCSKLLC